MAELYEKLAWGALLGNAAVGALVRGGVRAAPMARTVGSGALNFGRGIMGLPGAQNATRGMRMAHNAGVGAGAINTAKGIYDSVKPPEPPPAPPGVRPGMKVGSVDARLYGIILSKFAVDLDASTALDLGSYGAMIGSKLLPKENPWHTYLEGAGLLGLAGTTAAGMLTDPHERKPGAKDLLGLGLFGSALYDRWKDHAHESPDPVGP